MHRMISCDKSQVDHIKRQVDKKEIKKNLRIELANKCIGHTESINFKELKTRIISYTPDIENTERISSTTSENRIKEMIGFGIIQKNQQGQYILVAGNS